MKSILSVVAVVIGIVLLAASLVWALLFPAASGWTEEKSLRLSELSSRAHILGGELEAARSKPNMQRGKSAAEIETEFKQVTAELKELGAEADGKIEAPKTAAWIMRWAGVAFVVAGGLVIFAGRS
jgi:hypothetical protein